MKRIHARVTIAAAMGLSAISGLNLLFTSLRGTGTGWCC